MHKYKIVKKMFIIVLVFNMTFVNYASIVSDNDGSSFITKAEFDSLKNNFQSELDGYNQNIDNKIDAAISSYLAGIKVDKEVDMKSLIDDEGTYGNKIDMKWCSATDFRMISTNIPYPLQKYTWFGVYIKNAFPYGTGVNVNNLPSASGTWIAPLVNRDGVAVGNDYSDGTKIEYRVETIKIGTTNYRMLNLIKVVNIFNFVQFYGFPTNLTNAGAWSNGAGADVEGWTAVNFLADNNSRLTQSNLLKSVPLDYFRYWDATRDYGNGVVSNCSVIKTGSAMITQDYEQIYEHTYAPFSTVQEYVWDPNSDVTANVGSNSFYLADKVSTSGPVYWVGDMVNHGTSSKLGNVNHPKDLYFSWQYLLFKDGQKNESGNNVSAKESIIYNYYQIDKRNWKQKNGLVLSTTPNKDDAEVICECTSDVAGTVYFTAGGTIDDWQESTFNGVQYSLEPNVQKKCTLGKIPNELKNQPIWVLFAPSNTSKTIAGKFMVNRLYYKVSE